MGHIPAPSAVEGAVDKEQRVAVFLAGLALVDHFKHEIEFLSGR
jgi:hypothetical protein